MVTCRTSNSCAHVLSSASNAFKMILTFSTSKEFMRGWVPTVIPSNICIPQQHSVFCTSSNEIKHVSADDERDVYVTHIYLL